MGDEEAARGTGGTRAPYSASQRHDINLIAAFRGISFLGDAVAFVALFLRLAPLGHAWMIAALSMAGSLPLVVLTPVCGHVIDRVPAKAFLALLGLAEGVVCVGLAAWHGVAATLVLMFVLSSLGAFAYPGYAALVPFIAGEENVARSQGLMQSVQGVSNVAGPAVGGLLVGALGQSWPYLFDAVSFAVCALATTLLHHDRRPSPASDLARAETPRMTAGLRLIWNDDVVRPLIAAILIFMMAIGMVNVAEVFFITRTLLGSATLYGLVGASFGLGMVAGSLVAGRFSQQIVHLARAVLVSVLATGVFIGLAGFARHVVEVYPLMVIAGANIGIANVAGTTLFTVRTPEALRGRMFAAVNGILTGSQLGAIAAGGVVLTLVAPRTVYQIGGVAATASILVLGPLALRAARAAHQRELASGGVSA